MRATQPGTYVLFDEKEGLEMEFRYQNNYYEHSKIKVLLVQVSRKNQLVWPTDDWYGKADDCPYKPGNQDSVIEE